MRPEDELKRLEELRRATKAGADKVKLSMEPKYAAIAKELTSQLARAEADAAAERAARLRAESALERLRVEAGPYRLNQAFSDIARLALAETTWHRIWERAMERAQASRAEVKR